MAEVIREFMGEIKVGTFPVGAALVERGQVLQKSATGTVTHSAGADTERFAGFAEDTVDNSAGSAGDQQVRVIEDGIVKLVVGGADVGAAIGDPVYCDGVNSCVDANTSDLPVGYLYMQVSGTTWWVKFHGAGLGADIA